MYNWIENFSFKTKTKKNHLKYWKQKNHKLDYGIHKYLCNRYQRKKFAEFLEIYIWWDKIAISN